MDKLLFILYHNKNGNNNKKENVKILLEDHYLHIL